VLTDRWSRLRELFDGALAVDAAAREEFLRQACPDDDALRGEAASLVEAHERAGSFLADAVLKGGLLVDPAPDEDDLSGVLIGPYRILALVGRGGMGSVYRAQRADAAYEKVVALKVVKRGMDTASVLARFQAERTILARLEHPHIARLLDGGSTDDGRPWLVMEYVDGQRIDRWVETRGLDTGARLRLFLDVCSAVAHAHRNLVVHRDLKPANVLVTPDGVAKLLDFGVAKLLDPAETDGTVTAMVPLTPEYASPEQLKGDPVTTAADVYSLGVVLYELLTGRRPYRLNSRRPSEVARVVCEQEPERPSTAASRPPDADRQTTETGALTTVGERRARELAGDLDAVVLMALRKEPPRRYSSVEQLADDIRRHLDGRPVRARPDTFTYRAGKFVRRNRAAAALAALVALSLAGGMATTLWQARVARAERALAEQRFQDVRRMANSFLFEFHDSIAELPGATRARELVVRRALEYLDKLAAQAGDDPALQLELADAYEKLGTVQGAAGQANLGDLGGATASFRKGLDALRKASAARPDDHDVAARLMSQNVRLGRILSDAGRFDEALARQREALATAARVLERDPGHRRVRTVLVNVHRAIGYEQDRRGDTAGALASFRTAVSVAQALVAEKPDDAESRSFLARGYESLSDGLMRSGDRQGALDTFRSALKLRQEAAARDPGNAVARRNVAVLYMDVGDALRDLGHLEEARASYRQALAIHTALVAADPGNAQSVDDRFVSYAQMCLLSVIMENMADGREVCRRGLDDARLVARDAKSAHGQDRLGNAHLNLGRYRLLARDPRGAVEHLQQAAAIFSRLSAEAPESSTAGTQVAEARLYLGEALLAAGRGADARAALQESVSALQKLAGDDPLDADLQHLLAASYQRMGAAQGGAACGAARPWYEKAAAAWSGLRGRGRIKAPDIPLADRTARALSGCIR
jgi:non-specific serine/threonine protein kinase/serine/threonine-protein kinase